LILDAGCGIGGSAIWLAKKYGARVIGITLSDNQLRQAQQLAQQEQVADLTDFFIKDYLNTGFPDEAFDVVWAAESVCYAESKIDFLKEAFRILKNGGRLIIADGFLKRETKNKEEERWFNVFIKGLALSNLAKIDEFGEDLKKAGFKNMKYWDKTEAIKISSKKLYLMCLFCLPFLKVIEWLRLTPKLLTDNGLAGLAQYNMVKEGLAGYGVFYAEK
jgi:ubiquinone/menaquinone biosynthesis C-methylase UbiE